MCLQHDDWHASMCGICRTTSSSCATLSSCRLTPIRRGSSIFFNKYLHKFTHGGDRLTNFLLEYMNEMWELEYNHARGIL